ncbi:MAG: hypothetical protein U9M90_02180 [Patescibacteria group bacterium]|nr:hypothetical protein [Patescibacteria group bacterium]
MKFYRKENSPTKNMELFQQRQITPLNEVRDTKQEAHKINALILWSARQTDNIERSKTWYICFFILIASLLAYGLFLDNFLLSIIAILTALLFYLFKKREAQEFKFGITSEGVFAHDNIYEFSSLENFWIFYEPQGRKELSLKSTKKLMPYIHIPIGSADPTEIRKKLLQFLPEIEHEESIVDSLQHMV